MLASVVQQGFQTQPNNTSGAWRGLWSPLDDGNHLPQPAIHVLPSGAQEPRHPLPRVPYPSSGGSMRAHPRSFVWQNCHHPPTFIQLRSIWEWSGGGSINIFWGFLPHSWAGTGARGVICHQLCSRRHKRGSYPGATDHKVERGWLKFLYDCINLVSEPLNELY